MSRLRTPNTRKRRAAGPLVIKTTGSPVKISMRNLMRHGGRIRFVLRLGRARP